MKRFLSTLLFFILLAQALPVTALAAVGRVLSAEDLAAAYALTGYGEGIQSNGYHRGMMPNEGWSASQLTSYLEQQLDLNIHNISDILSRVACALAESPEAQALFQERGTFGRLQEINVEVEALRQELRYLKKQVETDGNTIAEMGRLMSEAGDAMFQSDQLRYSEKIRDAVSDLVQIRQTIVQNAPAWEKQIDQWQLQLQYGPADSADTQFIGDAVTELFGSTSQPVTNSAKVTSVSPSYSRASRLALAANVESNDAEASVTVISKNQVCLSLVAGENMTRKPVANVRVQIGDALKDDPDNYEDYYTNKDGLIVLPSNKFTADMFDVVHLHVRGDPRDQGYRDFMIEDLDLDLGDVYTAVLQPINGSSANGVESNASGDPYIVSACFNKKDIMLSDYNMIYSSANNQDFEIRVEVGNAEGQPELMMSWYENNGSLNKLKKCWAGPTSHKGNVYTFKGPWKQRFSPNASKAQRPTFSFGAGDDAVRYTSRLVSVRSATDKPLNEGTGGGGGVFGNVLGPGLSLGFSIPLGGNKSIVLGLDLPFTDYLPKFATDCAGFVVMYIGSDVFSDMVKEAKANWQSQDLKEFSRRQAYVEKKSGFANYKAQYNMAKEYYREKGWKLLGESTLKFGVYGVVTARWELDNDDPDVKTKLITARMGLGFTMTYQYSWTLSYPVGPVPVNITFTLGVTAGFALPYELTFCWVNGGFKNWEIKAIRDITVSVGISFSARLGFGIKGFVEAWVKCTASLNLLIRLYLDDDEPSSLTVTYNCMLSAGVTLFLASASFNWSFAQGKLYPNSNSANLLDHYMNEANAGPEIMEAAHDAPMDYTELTKEALQITSTTELNPIDSAMKVVTVKKQTFAFYIGEDTLNDGGRRKRVQWINMDSRYHYDSLKKVLASGEVNLQSVLDRDDYAFDVYTADDLIYVVGLCSRDFYDDGYVKPIDFPESYSDSYNTNAWFYLMVLEPDGNGGLTHKLSFKDEAGRNTFVCAKPTNYDYYSGNQYSHNSAVNPRITYAYPEWKNKNRKILSQFHVFGSTEAVDYDRDRTPSGATGFVYDSGNNDHAEMLIFLSDTVIQSINGSRRYDRVQFFANEMGQHSFSADNSYQSCLSFIALSRPRDDASADSVIEWYDFDMSAGFSGKQKHVVAIEKGPIDYIQVIPSLTKNGPANTVFYAMKEVNGDGVEQYRLHGLYIEPTISETPNPSIPWNKHLECQVTKYTYDMVLPTNYFNVAYIGPTPYLYWVSVVPKQKVNEPDVWRVDMTAYDMATNTFTSPAVFAQFKLPNFKYTVPVPGKGIGFLHSLEPAMERVILTSTGTGYFSAVAADITEISKRYRPAIVPRALYSFQEEFKPAANMKMAVPQELAVAAGDFIDVCLGVMNEGNLGIATMDVDLYDVTDNGSEKLIETVHINAIDPEKNKITMKSGGTVMEGKQVAYRLQDYDLGSTRQDWVLSREKNRYAVEVRHNLNQYADPEKLEGDAQYVKSDILMPGSTGAYDAAIKIPDDWASKDGTPVKKSLRFRISGLSVESNRAGVQSNAGDQENLITYALDEKTGKLTLRQPLKANGAAAEAIATGLYANEIDSASIDLDISIHDLSVSHRQYAGWDGQDWLDIMIHNYTASGENMKLTCAVYVDGETEPHYVNLPYYASAVTDNRTQTITVPVSALVDDPAAHSKARVEIQAVDQHERAYANNEFYVWLDGSPQLRVTELYAEIERTDRTDTYTDVIDAREGETVTMHVSVSGGTAPYRYQWQVYDPKTGKWVNLQDGKGIRGATTDTLTLDSVKPEWDGRKARCVITDADGVTIESGALTLRIRGSGGDGHADMPDTGDHSHLPVYLAVALAALLALWLLCRRKGRG